MFKRIRVRIRVLRAAVVHLKVRFANYVRTRMNPRGQVAPQVLRGNLRRPFCHRLRGRRRRNLRRVPTTSTRYGNRLISRPGPDSGHLPYRYTGKSPFLEHYFRDFAFISASGCSKMGPEKKWTHRQTHRI